MVSHKVSFKSYKHFLDYKGNDYEIKPFFILHPKMSRHVTSFDETKYISFLIKDDKFQKKYNKIWD